MKSGLSFAGALAPLFFVMTTHASPLGLGGEATPVSDLAPQVMPAAESIGMKVANTGKPGPLRFALPIQASITPSAQGQWETLSGNRLIWRALISSEGASSLNFGFTRYNMPTGAELYVYGINGDNVRGPYTAAQNGSGQLWTPVIPGSEAVIEVDLSAEKKDQLQLELGQVNHGFLEFWKAGAMQKSGACNVDVVCPQGDGWRNEIRSVGRFTISGQFLCSGQLINNTRQDFSPYFLTANHCLSSTADATSTVYYWNYQTSVCSGSPDGRLDQNQSGASLVATYAPSDFTLLQLSQKPDPNFKVYYAGWDNSDAAPNGATCIHHPGGNEKRISFTNHPTHPASYGVDYSDTSSNDQTHLQIEKWDTGTTEGGSSGSGLWNNSHRLVGQLHGGNASCDASSASDWFGRLAVSWTGGGHAGDGLKPNLDPLNSSATALDGADPAGPAPPGKTSAVSKYGGAIQIFSLLSLLGVVWLKRRRDYSPSSRRYLRNRPRN